MSSIYLKDVKVPNIQIINTIEPKGEKIVFAIHYGLPKEAKSSGKEYIGKCKAEIFLESEKESDNRSFFVSVEVVGIFEDEDSGINSKDRKNAVLSQLFPHLSATISTVMVLAKINSSLIPQTFLPGADDYE